MSKHTDEVLNKIREFVDAYGTYPVDIVLSAKILSEIHAEYSHPITEQDYTVAGLRVIVGYKEEIKVGVLV